MMENKTIHLTVSHDYDVPNELINGSPAYVESVLKSGIRIISEREKLLKASEELEETQAQNEVIEKFLQEKREEMQKLQIERDCLEAQLQETRDQASNLYEAGIKSGRKQQEEIDKAMFELRETIDDIHGNVNFIGQQFNRRPAHALEISQSGETFVESIIASLFPQEQLEVTASTNNSCDLLLTTNLDVKILIEVKNKERHSDMDLKKFHADIENVKKKRGIHAALFISLRDRHTIHNYSYSYLEVRHDIPVLYLGEVLKAPTILHTALIVLSHLAQSGLCVKADSGSENSDSDNQYVNLAQECANDFVISYQREMVGIARLRKYIKKIEEEIGLHEKSLTSRKTFYENIGKMFPNLHQRALITADPDAPVTVCGGDKKQVVVERTRKPTKSKEEIIQFLQENKDKVIVVNVKDKTNRENKVEIKVDQNISKDHLALIMNTGVRSFSVPGGLTSIIKEAFNIENISKRGRPRKDTTSFCVELEDHKVTEEDKENLFKELGLESENDLDFFQDKQTDVNSIMYDSDEEEKDRLIAEVMNSRTSSNSESPVSATGSH